MKLRIRAIASGAALRALLLLIVSMSMPLMLRGQPASGQFNRANSPARRVTINYNMECVLGSSLRLETILSPAAKRLQLRSVSSAAASALASASSSASGIAKGGVATVVDPFIEPPQPVEFKVLLNNGSAGNRRIDLYIHPRIQTTVQHLEPAPIALEVSKFGTCEDYNQFLMHPICTTLADVSAEELGKLQPYVSQCRHQPALIDKSSTIHSIYAVHHTRLNRYLCAARNGTVYASVKLLADCFLFVRQLTDSESSTKPSCFVSGTPRMSRHPIIQQARAADYYLVMSAVYPQPVNDSEAKCRVIKRMRVAFGNEEKARWLIGVELSGTMVIRQKKLAANTLWQFDTVQPGQDRNIPKIERPTSTSTSTAQSTTSKSTSTSRSAPQTASNVTGSYDTTTNTSNNGRTRGTSTRRPADNVRDRSRGRAVPVEQYQYRKDPQQLSISLAEHRSFLDHLMDTVNTTMQQPGAAERVNEAIVDAAANRQRGPRLRPAFPSPAPAPAPASVPVPVPARVPASASVSVPVQARRS